MGMIVVMWLALLVQSDVGFTNAQADARDAKATTVQIELEVALHGSSGPVVAHLVLPGEAEQVKPLTVRGGDRWGSVIELRRADWHLVFEDLASGTLSQEFALTDLGVDPALLGPGTGDSGRTSEEATSPAWAAALATFAGLVTLLAVWAIFSRSSRSTSS